MGRPQSFKYAFVALHHTPYTEVDEQRRVRPSGGVLSEGQIVWADHLHQWQPSLATAFVESVGVVALDPRWLVPAEEYQRNPNLSALRGGAQA